MKKLLTIAALASLFIFGCNEETNIVSPVDGSPTRQLTLISLPAPSDLTVESLYTEEMQIVGEDGGTFQSEYSYEGGPTGLVTINSNLQFLPNAFTGTVDISQTFNTETASVTFGPSMQFSIPVVYNLTISGVDISDLDPNTLGFVYIAADGSIQECIYDSVSMNAATGTLSVTNAQLQHFSRYGFVN
jgi:hypothetical protein